MFRCAAFKGVPIQCKNKRGVVQSEIHRERRAKRECRAQSAYIEMQPTMPVYNGAQRAQQREEKRQCVEIRESACHANAVRAACKRDACAPYERRERRVPREQRQCSDETDEECSNAICGSGVRACARER